MDILVSRPTANLVDRYFSAVRDFKLDIFAAVLHVGGKRFFKIQNLVSFMTVMCVCASHTHMITDTHFDGSSGRSQVW